MELRQELLLAFHQPVHAGGVQPFEAVMLDLFDQVVEQGIGLADGVARVFGGGAGDVGGADFGAVELLPVVEPDLPGLHGQDRQDGQGGEQRRQLLGALVGRGLGGGGCIHAVGS